LSKFFFVENLTEKTVRSDLDPWDFHPSVEIPENIRLKKIDRQEFYRSPQTKHYFYSGLEGANPNQRISKDNPPKLLHQFCADYDAKIPPTRIEEVISAMRVKPAWTECSLGGNLRLVWLLETPLRIDSYDFGSYLLDKAVKWLRLSLLPAFDEGAFTDPSRLLCNGCSWKPTGHGSIDASEVQAFYVEVGREYNFRATDGCDIPLDIIEPALHEKFSGFNWPTDFSLDTQGPTFWIPDSASPMSAIVKKDGMFTFSDHAGKPFFSWAEILGVEFVRRFETDSIAKATKDIFFDEKHFWSKRGGNIFVRMDDRELGNFFKVSCRISSKPGKDGLSQIDKALDHIYRNARITGAAPFVFRHHGVIEYQGDRMLNTYINRVMQPADELTPWGASGKFAWLSLHFDNLFDPPEQLVHFLAWLKHFYTSGYTSTPMPGQNVFLMGVADVGKTLTSRGIIGPAVGGFCDGAEHLMRTDSFNPDVWRVPLLCVDDETMGENSQTQSNFHAMLKKTTANQQFKYNKKFETASVIEWMGRIFVTTNLDYISSRALGSMDNTSQDKTHIFRCSSEKRTVFPNRYELGATIMLELPFLLRWLLAWNPPESVIRHARFGYEAYHEPALLDQAHQGGRSAPFKELLIESLVQYFSDNPAAIDWRGTVTQVLRLMHNNPLNETIMRTLRLEQATRYLESIQREGVLHCTVETASHKTRIWIFKRFE